MINILMAEDNETDAVLFRRAVGRLEGEFNLITVNDGEKVIAYFTGQGIYADRNIYPFPDYLVLDLKMPRKTGFDVLEWLRANPQCHIIPTIVFTASEMDHDIERTYELGANTYFTKPEDFHKLVDLLRLMVSYWNEAKRPKSPPGGRC